MSGAVAKPDIPSVHDVLREHRALVVHFSSVPPLDNTEHYFPDDLRHALQNPNMPGGLCCSVVKPGDTPENAFGTVGLIFDLSNIDSLIAVSQVTAEPFSTPMESGTSIQNSKLLIWRQ